MLTQARNVTSTQEVKEARLEPVDVVAGKWVRETTIGSKTRTEDLYTVNATVYRVKNASKFIDLVKQSLEASGCQQGDSVALYSRKRGKLLARAEVAVFESGAKVSDIDVRQKPAAQRRQLEKSGAAIAIVDTQSDLDRLLKTMEKDRNSSIRKILVLGAGVQAPEAQADKVIFARDAALEPGRSSRAIEMKPADARNTRAPQLEPLNLIGDFAGLAVPRIVTRGEATLPPAARATARPEAQAASRETVEPEQKRERRRRTVIRTDESGRTETKTEDTRIKNAVETRTETVQVESGRTERAERARPESRRVRAAKPEKASERAATETARPRATERRDERPRRERAARPEMRAGEIATEPRSARETERPANTGAGRRNTDRRTGDLRAGSAAERREAVRNETTRAAETVRKESVRSESARFESIRTERDTGRPERNTKRNASRDALATEPRPSATRAERNEDPRAERRDDTRAARREAARQPERTLEELRESAAIKAVATGRSHWLAANTAPGAEVAVTPAPERARPIVSIREERSRLLAEASERRDGEREALERARRASTLVLEPNPALEREELRAAPRPKARENREPVSDIKREELREERMAKAEARAEARRERGDLIRAARAARAAARNESRQRTEEGPAAEVENEHDWSGTLNMPSLDRAAVKAALEQTASSAGPAANRVVEDRFVARPMSAIVADIVEIDRRLEERASQSLQVANWNPDAVAVAEPAAREKSEPAALELHTPVAQSTEPSASREPATPDSEILGAGKILRFGRAHALAA